MSALEESAVIAEALDACAHKLDGSAASPEYYRRRRRVFYSALKYAVREKRLSANPLDGSGLDREWKAPAADYAVNLAFRLLSWADASRSFRVYSGTGDIGRLLAANGRTAVPPAPDRLRSSGRV